MTFERVYGMPFADISVTEKYYEMVDDARSARRRSRRGSFFQTLAELQFESGYPYIMYEDTVNRANPIEGKITPQQPVLGDSCRCPTPSVFNEDLTYAQVGKDISCNLGSLNIAKAMDSPELRAEQSRWRSGVDGPFPIRPHIWSVPSIEQGNNDSHAIGLGQMNLHGYLARERIFYGSEEGHRLYEHLLLHRAVSRPAGVEQDCDRAWLATSKGFEKSKYASGEFFDRYTEQVWEPKTDRVKQLFADAGIHIPTQEDWGRLKESVQAHGIYNQNCRRCRLRARSAISTIRQARFTRSRRRSRSARKARSGGCTTRPYMTNDNLEYYEDAYEIGYEKVIDT